MMLEGDWIEVLRTLESESVHCVVTSPPYWGLRDYGTPGQLGLESTPEEYVRKMVEGFREVRRVLRKDGTLWLNLGDSYNAAGRDGHGTRVGYKQGTNRASANGDDWNRPSAETLKPKDLVGIPWRVAFALQADGWYLRSDIIWSKPNPMPESVTDRPTKAHEYLFLLSKSERYYYDAEAIKEAVTGNAHARGDGVNPKCVEPGQGIKQNSSFSAATKDLVWSRNRRTVWTIPTQPFPEAHFATFPEELVKPCILAGTSEKGVCVKCGAPWERIIETVSSNRRDYGSVDEHVDLNNGRAGDTHTKTLGWRPTCSCGTEETKRSVVLDPFGGSGTVGKVAQLNHCESILIELNPAYIEIAERRLSQGVLEW